VIQRAQKVSDASKILKLADILEHVERVDPKTRSDYQRLFDNLKMANSHLAAAIQVRFARAL
jgi:hypothetical protein